MASCPTQAWQNNQSALFLLKGQNPPAKSPFVITSADSLNNLTLFVDNNALPNPLGGMTFNSNGVTVGPTLAMDRDSFLFKFNILGSALTIQPAFSELYTPLYITDSNYPTGSLYFSVDGAPLGAGATIQYPIASSQIRFERTGGILLNTYVQVENLGQGLNVYDATQRLTQISSHDVLFGDTSGNPIGGIYANGTAVSIGCSNYPSSPALSVLAYKNIVTIDSGIIQISQNLVPVGGGLESRIDFEGGAMGGSSPSYSLINNISNIYQRVANCLNFTSGYAGNPAVNHFYLDCIGEQTAFTTEVNIKYDGVSDQTGDIIFTGGGAGGQYGGAIALQDTHDGMTIVAKNWITGAPADLTIAGSTIQLGTSGSPANVTINGNPVSVLPQRIQAYGNSGSFFSLPAFPNINLANPTLLVDIDFATYPSLKTLPVFTLSVNCGTSTTDAFNNSVWCLGWNLIGTISSSPQAIAFSPYITMTRCGSFLELIGSSGTGIFSFYNGVDYFPDSTNIQIRAYCNGAYPSTRMENPNWTWSIY